MSHFTRIKTKIVEQEHLLQALHDLGYRYESGDVEIRGYGGNRIRVELKVTTSSPGYDIGFQRNGSVYECVADWWGIHDLDQQQFLGQLMQRYAYHTATAKLAEQGFDLVTEEKQEDGRIHLTLRRMG